MSKFKTYGEARWFFEKHGFDLSGPGLPDYFGLADTLVAVIDVVTRLERKRCHDAVEEIEENFVCSGSKTISMDGMQMMADVRAKIKAGE